MSPFRRFRRNAFRWRKGLIYRALAALVVSAKPDTRATVTRDDGYLPAAHTEATSRWAGLFSLETGHTDCKGPRIRRVVKEVRFALLTLSCEPRGRTKSARNEARRRGFIPAVVYGKEVEPTPIIVPAVAMRDALKTGARNQLFRLEGLDRPHTVLIKDVQIDQIHRDYVHIDFMEPAKGQKIRVRVPIYFYGEDQVTKRGLIMTHQLNEVEVECQPDHIPAAVTVDLTTRGEGDHISIGDLHAPNGARIMMPADTVVLNIDVPLSTMIPGEGNVDVTTAGA